jgi:hypothetical protein
MAKSKAKQADKRPSKVRAQESLDKLLKWFEEHKPKYQGEIHVTLSDDTLRKFATKVTNDEGSVVPGLWIYRKRTLRQHHDVKPRGA